MKRHGSKQSAICRGALAGVLLLGSTALWAQAPGGNRPAAAPLSARDQAPYDLSGYWVSLITQNWRPRMVVLGPGDYEGVPMNAEGKKIADAWTPAKAEEAARTCEAYGGGIIMWLPERLHISWQDPNELKVETDAGMQTRVLHFASAAGGARAGAADAMSSQPPGNVPPTLQGYSVAHWVPSSGARGAPGAAPTRLQSGTLQVTTDHMLPGLMRRNGVPYDGDAKKTEWWDLRKISDDEQWLVISTTVVEPHYLTRPYTYDPIFQKEADGAKWDPTPCSQTP